MKKLICITLFLLITTSSVYAGSKTHATEGLLIGTASGTAIGLTTSLLVTNKFSCGNTRDESCLSSQKRTSIVLGSTLGTAALGAGLGFLVGKAIPKKQSMSLTPILTHDKQNGTMGAMMFSGEF